MVAWATPSDTWPSHNIDGRGYRHCNNRSHTSWRMNPDPQITPAEVLRIAAFNGDEFTVRHLVAEGVDTNINDPWGRTPLSLAAGAGHLGVVRILIDSGAWVNPHENYDIHETPLLAAAENGHLDIVKVLIAAGADPKLFVGQSQATPEFYARTNGHSQVSEYLRLYSS